MKLQLRTKPHEHRRAATRRRRGAEPAPSRSPRPAPAPERVGPEERMRRAGGPEDTALYSCSCGYVFDALVTAGVSCPHCGGEQAW